MGRQVLHEGAIVVTGSGICGTRGVIALFGAQFLELLKGGLFCGGKMTDMTLQPGLGASSFWGGRAHVGILVL